MEPHIFRMSTDEIIHIWSTDRDPSIAHQDNLKAFVQTPTADTKPLLDSAWKWLLLAKNIISKDNKHYIASGLSKKNKLQPADITTYENALKKTSWKSFDVFIRGINMCRVVTLNNQDFRHSKCSCPSYDKTNICKRIIGVASYFKLYTIPLEIKTCLWEKNERVVPLKKAIKALVRIARYEIL
ncbi:hypothetical protein BpHYR1_002354 [Brachionus plicatilis]|uniref:SWIM-type domain-containing protein n=1 Tax=Brachionus plicatilis TaxID=10195 RepID=A0A3M7Q5A5_BRAPC|nr:hypothetical protein BpHYR1_002354 [Brachionus plicatilis]